MEARLAALEAEAKDARSSLGRLEVSNARIEATLASLSTRADVAATTERVAGLDRRIVQLEAAVADVVRSAVGKSIGPWQLPGVLAACCGLVVALAAAIGWLEHQPWFAK